MKSLLLALYWHVSWFLEGFCPFLVSSSLSLNICVAALPDQTPFSSFPILLSMCWHFYPCIKTFKSPQFKRKECCFNSLVDPCLGPFFSVANQPAFTSCLMFSSPRIISPLRLVTAAQRGPCALFSLLQALRADYKLLACLALLQSHCFSLSTCGLQVWTELAALASKTFGLFGAFVTRSVVSASELEKPN